MIGAGRITGVAHTGVSTSDIGRTLAFFRDVLGFEVTEPGRYGGEVFERITGVEGAQIDIAYVHAPGHTLEILQYVEPAQKQTSTLRPCDNGHLHLSFNVDGIDAVLQRMKDAGFEPVGPVQTVQEKDVEVRAIYTKGPDGLIIELMQITPNS